MAILKEKTGREKREDHFYLSTAEPPEKGQRLHFDDHRDAPRGFGIRVTPVKSGNKEDGDEVEASIAFILKYTFDGRQRRLSIGQWPTWSLKAARDHAGELARKIDRGIDPLEEKNRRRSDPTVEDAVSEYVEKYVSGLSSAKPISRYFTRDVVPVLGNKKLTDVTRRDLIDLIEDKAAETPIAARHLLAYLKRFFDWCIERDLIELSPAAGIKPKSINVAGKKNALRPVKRKRVLSDDEIRELWHCETNMHPLTMLALKLVLVTGQRPGEVAGMHESELQENVWTIPARRRGKTESEHAVGLPPLAMGIIEQARAEVARLSKRRKATGGFIFEVRAGQPLAVDALSKAVARHRDELGNVNQREAEYNRLLEEGKKTLPKGAKRKEAEKKLIQEIEGKVEGMAGHWTPHDLRRTCRTGMAAAGISDEIAERVVGHVSEAMVDTYNTHKYVEEKRLALSKWESRLRRVVDEQTDNNVVELAG